ncbi:MAG: DNA gyrase subunit A [Dehalococcoidia bacterium]|nr:DNA gyrase subunit A [Dehalococcoidia bacterium]
MVTIPDDQIQNIRIDDEMRNSYLSYAMSVIVARALPDVRDGLKPVQRRILYAMRELSLSPNNAHKKCARIVGEVLGKYHPHGDSPVYEALVRMAQDFSLHYPLVDGQGNFGSVDDDPPAAMRYTEARLTQIAMELLADIDQNTVEFVENFDGSLKEPTVLPGKIPNLLLNGASGIAVGMATNIPPHNLGEICSAVCYLIDNPNAFVEDLMKFVKAPDFPTGATALVGNDREFVRQIYSTGRGRVVVRATADIEELKSGRSQIIVSELPYQVNKATLVARIAQMVRDKRIDGISDIRDESDRTGMRVVIELKRDAMGQMVVNSLYKHTSMQSSFSVNMLALVDGQPQVLNLKRVLQLFIDYRKTVVIRRAEFQLKKAKDRSHILEGLRKALEFLDEVIKLIRGSDDVESARHGLIQTFGLTEIQAQAILDMQLRRLAALERKKLEEEYQDLSKTIEELESLLGDTTKILDVVKEETLELKKQYRGTRLTKIIKEEPRDLSPEDLISPQDMVVTISRRGYIKRILPSTYKSQHRGGRGVRGQATRDDDALHHLLYANTHDTILLFTNRGRVYKVRCFEIHQDSSRTTKGASLNNLIPLAEKEEVNAVVSVANLDQDGLFVMGTRLGEVKSLRIRKLANIRSNGLIVMDLEEGDDLVSVRNLEPDDDVLIVTSNGRSIRFPGIQIPVRSRTAGGVRGIKLIDGDHVVAMEPVNPDERLLVVTENGYGKVVTLNRYPRQRRAGQGVRVFKVTPKTGKLADAQLIREGIEDEVMLVSARSQVIRTSIQSISVQGRNASGVIVWRPDSRDKIVSVACFSNVTTPNEKTTE